MNVSDGSNLNEAQANGHLTDVRVIQGTAVYASAFTPTAERLTVVTNTSLLIGNLPYLADGSTNNHTLTSNGNPSMQPFTPYDYSQYSSVTNGGSIYFDGSGDYVSMASDTSFGLGTGDFTIEWWAYQTATASYAQVFAVGNGAGGIGAHMRNNGDITVTRPGTAVDHTFAANLSSSGNTWYHVALVRNGSTLTCFVNGTSVGTGTNSTNYAASHLNIGIDGNNSSSPFTGIISDFRIVKGTAVYTTNFTPPTTPLTAITNTSLLLKGTNAGIIDKSQSLKEFILGGNTKSSTTQTKYLTSSMAFDGTGDNIPFYPSAPFGTGDFTIEFWWYPTDTNKQALFMGTTGTDHSIAISYGMPSGNTIGMWASSNGTSWNMMNCDAGGNGIGSETVNQNAWNHIAMTRASGTFKLFVNGALDVTITGQTGQIADYGQGTYKAIIGQWYTTGTAITDIHGYLSDFRISNGLARYTAAFTPPTAALKG